MKIHNTLKNFSIITVVILLFISVIIKKFNITPKDELSEPIKFVYITDNNYVNYLRTSIRSIIANKNPKTRIVIYVVEYNVSDANIDKIKKEQRSNVAINIIPSPKDKLDKLNGGSRINPKVTKADNAKFFLASLLKNVGKVIYLDADTIVLKDLSDLYNTDLADNYVAAVDDWESTWADSFTKRYFNNGVMLLNLENMRRNNIEKELVDYKINDKFPRFVTQDAFNSVMYGKVLYMPLIYNTFAPEFDNERLFIPRIRQLLGDRYNTKLYPYKNIQEYRDDVRVIHYCGYSNIKPWYKLDFKRKSSVIWYKYAPLDFWINYFRSN